MAGAFPAGRVEGWYATTIFPWLSLLAGRVADAIPFSWLDLLVPGGLALVVAAWKKKRLRWILSGAAVAYLLFFWTWGINYHRMPLVSKLPFDREKTTPENIGQFAQKAAARLNDLYDARLGVAVDPERIRNEASRRAARVVTVIDGTSWQAASKVKTSVVVNPWFRIAGVDGMFNPLGHEPVVSKTLLDVEQPFVMAHEFAHVRGYPAEGDANMIALLATVMSDDLSFQYSGWLHLWLYLRSRELDEHLDEGPRTDLQRIFERARTERIQWISNVQTAVLDLFLKANSVEQGVRSYSEIVKLAAGTEENWERFR
ncbi:MAG: DUF3810 family protein [Acidobacteria bacterium]|nr:DUF3810 family protein [Acidobacteriota bacterium]